MGSHTTITCSAGHTFDAPEYLADKALALHQQIVHDYPEKEACRHVWVGSSIWVGLDDAWDKVCQVCGRRKMIFRA